MTTKEEIKRVKELLSCGDYSVYTFDELLDQYDSLKAIETFENTQPTYFTTVVKNAKEIALNAAISAKPYGQPQGQLGNIAGNYDVLAQAERIHQWLIKDIQP